MEYSSIAPSPAQSAKHATNSLLNWMNVQNQKTGRISMSASQTAPTMTKSGTKRNSKKN